MIEEEQEVPPVAPSDAKASSVAEAVIQIVSLLIACFFGVLFIGSTIFHFIPTEIFGEWASLLQTISGILSLLGMTGLISVSKRLRRWLRTQIARVRQRTNRNVLLVYVDSDRQWARWLEETLDNWKCVVISLNWQPGIAFQEELAEAQRKVRKTFFLVSLELLDRLRTLKQTLNNEKSYRAWERKHLFKRSHELIFLHEKAFQAFRLKELAPGNFASLPTEEEALKVLQRWLTPWAGPSQANQTKPDRKWRYPGARPAGWNVPGGSEPFIGRKKEREALRQAFRSRKAVVLHGLRGCGKTEIAKEYAHSCQDKYTRVLWLSMENPSQYKIDLHKIVSELNIVESGKINYMKTGSLEQALRQWLGQNSDWLLILDECQRASTMAKCYNRAMNGHVLITTSAKPEDFMHFACIEVGEMEEEDAREFIIEALKSGNGTAISLPPEEVAKNMLPQLGKVPEMLQAFCLYVRSGSGSPAQYLVELAQRRQNRLLQRGTGNLSCDRSEDSWMLYFDKIQERSAEEIMKYCALLHPGPIPVEIIANISQLNLSDEQLTDALNKLGYYFLVERNREDELSVKPHIHDYFRDWLAPATRKDLAVHLLQALSKTMLIPAVANVRASLDYAIQAQACEELIQNQKYTLPDKDIADFYDAYGHYLIEHAEFKKAEDYLRKGLAIRQQLVQRGAPNQDLAIAKNGSYRARALSAQGQPGDNDQTYLEIEQLWQQQLAALRAAPGDHSLEIATALFHLARHYSVWRQPNENKGPKQAEFEQICRELKDSWLKIEQSSQSLTLREKLDLLKQQGSLAATCSTFDASVEKYEAALKLINEALLDKALPSLQRRILTVEALLCQARINRNTFQLRTQKPNQPVQDLQEKEEASLESLKNYLGKHHQEVARVQMDLADLYMYINDANAANIACGHAAKIYKQIMPGHKMIEYYIQGMQERIRGMGGSF